MKVRSAKEILNKKFDELSKSNLKHGIIKIDVEGYERMVLEGIAKSIPANFKAIIIFENWDSNLDHKEIKKLFSRKVKIKKLCRSIVGTSKSKLSKFFSLLLNNDETMLKQAKEDMTLIGDVIIELY